MLLSFWINFASINIIFWPSEKMVKSNMADVMTSWPTKKHVIVYNKRRAIYSTQNYFHMLFQGKPRGKGSIIPCLVVLPPLFKELGQVLCEPLRTLTPPLFMRILSAQVTHVEMPRHIMHRACALRRNINKLKACTGCVSLAALYSFFLFKKNGWWLTFFLFEVHFHYWFSPF